MIRPCRPLRRIDPRTGLDDRPTNRLATQDSSSPNPRHLSRKGHLFHARQTIMAARSITNLALQTRPALRPFSEPQPPPLHRIRTYVMVESRLIRADVQRALDSMGHTRLASKGPP